MPGHPGGRVLNEDFGVRKSCLAPSRPSVFSAARERRTLARQWDVRAAPVVPYSPNPELPRVALNGWQQFRVFRCLRRVVVEVGSSPSPSPAANTAVWHHS